MVVIGNRNYLMEDIEEVTSSENVKFTKGGKVGWKWCGLEEQVVKEEKAQVKRGVSERPGMGCGGIFG